MNVTLLGGAFNPPHVGHLMIARQVLDFGKNPKNGEKIDEVWFLPNYGQIPPKPVETVEHRVAMVSLLVMNQTKISTLEIDHRLDGDTINLLPCLPKEHNFSFIIGSDQLTGFHLWGKWQELLRAIPFLVFPRYGYPNEPLYPGMTLISDDALIASNISSTKIRERVKRGLSIEEFVPKEIAEYIHTHNLYQK